MRRVLAVVAGIHCVITLMGCVPPLAGDAAPLDPLGVLVSAVENPADEPQNPADSATSDDAAAHEETSRVFSGTVVGDEYQLLDLGPGLIGDEWRVTVNGPVSGPFVVVLLDADQNLLMRTYLAYTTSLCHILREDTERVYLGVMPPASGRGGHFRFKAALETERLVPAPAPQVVWLNFREGNNVRVHRNDPLSFAPFDGAMVGQQYADYTQEMKDVIVREMRADYASYNVTILASDEVNPPEGAYSTIHFGGSEPGLLGLADNVDNYNQNAQQNAIVYVENFAPYWTMQLEPDEMAVMIANVASHELGHLLGLYHTARPEDIMDTTASAWELAENQAFVGGPLEQTVFATGWEDCPRLLAQIVGEKDQDSAKAAARQKSPKWSTYKAIRRFAHDQMHSKCGTCLSLAHE